MNGDPGLGGLAGGEDLESCVDIPGLKVDGVSDAGVGLDADRVSSGRSVDNGVPKQGTIANLGQFHPCPFVDD